MQQLLVHADRAAQLLRQILAGDTRYYYVRPLLLSRESYIAARPGDYYGLLGAVYVLHRLVQTY